MRNTPFPRALALDVDSSIALSLPPGSFSTSEIYRKNIGFRTVPDLELRRRERFVKVIRQIDNQHDAEMCAALAEVRSHWDMQNTFKLADSECSFISQALVLAADKYVGFAVDAIGLAGGERLQQQFLRQACEARKFAIAFGDSDGIEIPSTTNLRRAGHDAGRITNQQFADTIRERLAQGKAVA